MWVNYIHFIIFKIMFEAMLKCERIHSRIKFICLKSHKIAQTFLFLKDCL